MAERMVLRDSIRIHTDMVTSIATPKDNSPMIVSSSRDKSISQWYHTDEENIHGISHCHLTGHSHFVQDVVLSNTGDYALSASWDGDIRLWDLSTGDSLTRFTGHTNGVLSVDISKDDRRIASASLDRTIKVWNTLGECMYTMQDGDAHNDWVSCVRFSPDHDIIRSTLVSGSWDGTVKVWDVVKGKLMHTCVGHKEHVNTVAVSPDGSVCASGGTDGVVLIWDMKDGKRLYSFDAGSCIRSLCFCPSRYWLCAATEASIRIWDLNSKSIIADLKVDDDLLETQDEEANGTAEDIHCVCLNWSIDGSTLFSGYDDGVIRVWCMC